MSAEPIPRYLVDDGETLFIGPAAEAKFGRRHFMGMTAAFTAPPQFTVISGMRSGGPIRCCSPSGWTDRV